MANTAVSPTFSRIAPQNAPAAKVKGRPLRPRAWFYPKHLDESVMQRAASQFVGTHDFRAVRSVGTETRTTVRTVHYFQVERKGELIECRGSTTAAMNDKALNRFLPSMGDRLSAR